jgi:hypothetical protein
MNVLCILGSRLKEAPEHVVYQAQEEILTILSHYDPRDWYVISGGAVGIDRMAQFLGEAEGFQVYPQLALWNRGKQAGFERNSFMIHISDHVYAIQWNNSSGTGDSISKSRKKGNLKGVITL